ncbi:ATP-binding protein [Yinghuangia soli]|uniref:AAA family ATPase n=1 Tax=Yinghuangia soli TaxID=2908204 RepID=A0AA41PXA3_9ACTN|nr:AAA family ATPase [Yinghuangia soli]MCF2527554.1 AAA family ATPase [Yinghuangia soli]
MTDAGPAVPSDPAAGAPHVAEAGGGRLIGRVHAAGLLRAEVERAAVSHGGLVLVTGEAGIGKTTLVTGAADEARQRDALVLGGSCWDSGNAPGYWPWVQVLRALRRALGEAAWRGLADPLGPSLGVLAGDAVPVAEAEEAGKPQEDAPDAFQIYDAVTTLLVSASQDRPLVVVLDDLHWADSASLRLLEFAARHAWFERILLIGTYRDVEAESPGHPLRPLILPLLAKATSVTLTGLEQAEVGALMARTAGRMPDAALVAEVHRRTGGNPFFVEQTARLWAGGGDVSAIAPGVREAVRRRLELLPAQVGDLLATAAVLGRVFDRGMLAATAGAPVPHVDRLLDHAVSARLVAGVRAGTGASEGGTRPAGRFEFTHDLVRETLYEGLGEDEVRRRHAAAVRAHRIAPDRRGARQVPADVARHAYLAGRELPAEEALDLLVDAARAAEGRLAFEEAAGHLRRAGEAAERLGDARRRTVVVLSLGDTLRHNGAPDAWTHLQSAAEQARAIGDPELLARVALTLYRDPSTTRADYILELLRDAHRALIGRGDPAADGLAADRIARELAVRFAVLARREEDDEALGFSLWATHDTIWGPGSAAERLPLTDEMIAVARRMGDVEMELHASSMRWVALLENGDPAYHEQFRSFVADAERVGQPRFLMGAAIDSSLIAALTGRFPEAEQHFDDALGELEQADHGPYQHMPAHMRWSLLFQQGRYDELDALHRELVAADHHHTRLLAALDDVERGRTGEALRYLHRMIDASGGGEVVGSPYAPLWLRFQAVAAAASGDPGLCERARREIAPYRDQWTVSLYGCDISGPMVLWAAVVEAGQERWDAAVDGFTAAVAAADALRARPWAVQALVRLAEALAARGGPGDAAAAEEALRRAESEAREIGMQQVPAWAGQVRGTLAGRTGDAPASHGGAGNGTAHGSEPYDGASGPTGSAAPARPAPQAAPAPRGVQESGTPRTDTARFRLDGPVWQLTYAGTTVHMPDAKGLRDLHHLLGRPGTEVPAVRLLNPAGGDVVVAARGMGGDAVLDEAAKAAYKRRLARLDDEIDRAAELGDDAKAAAYDAERAALLDELRAAAGLGGRARRLGDEAERARKTVTARIKDTLRRMDAVHPALAAHLRATVATGSSCTYRDDGTTAWRL